MSNDAISHVRVLAQQDPLSNRLRNFGDRLKDAKARVADLEQDLKYLDEESAALQEAGVRITYTLGEVGDAAAARRRDLANTHIFERGTR